MPRATRLADRIWTAMAWVWLALFPLWQDGSYTRITRAKWEGMVLLTAVCAALTLLTALYALLRREKMPFRFGRHQLIALLLFGWMGLSALTAPYRFITGSSGPPAVWMGALRYEGMATQLCYLAIFLIMSLHPIRMKPVLHAAAAALLLFCGVVIDQYAGQNPLGLFPAGRSIRTNYEFQGTLGNIDMISGYLALVVPLLLASFLLAKKGGWLWYAAGLAGVALWCCMEVQSGLLALLLGLGLMAAAMLLRADCRPRGCLLLAGVLASVALRTALVLPWLDGGKELLLLPSLTTAALLLVAALCLGAAHLLHKHPGQDIPAKRVAVITCAVLIIGLIFFLLLPLTDADGGLWEIQQMLLGRAEDAFGSYRVGVWRHTLAIAGEHPLLGTGPDTFYYALKDRLAALGATLPEPFDNPHNEYLAYAANCGFPALALYVLLLGMLLRRRAKTSWPLLSATACYALQGIFSFSICLVSPMWWAIMGMEESNG